MMNIKDTNILILSKKLQGFDSLHDIDKNALEELNFGTKQRIFNEIFSKRMPSPVLDNLVTQRAITMKSESKEQQIINNKVFEKVYLQLIAKELRYLGCPSSITAVSLLKNKLESYRAFSFVLNLPHDIIKSKQAAATRTKQQTISVKPPHVNCNTQQTRSKQLPTTKPPTPRINTNQLPAKKPPTPRINTNQLPAKKPPTPRINTNQLPAKNPPAARILEEPQPTSILEIDFNEYTSRDEEQDQNLHKWKPPSPRITTTSMKKKKHIPKVAEEEELPPSILEIDFNDYTSREEEDQLQFPRDLPKKKKQTKQQSNLLKENAELKKKNLLLENELENLREIHKQSLFDSEENPDRRRMRWLEAQNKQYQRHIKLFAESANTRNDALQRMENDLLALKQLNTPTLKEIKQWAETTHQRLIHTQAVNSHNTSALNNENLSFYQKFSPFLQQGSSFNDIIFGNPHILNIQAVSSLSSRLSDFYNNLVNLQSQFDVILSPFLLFPLEQKIHESVENTTQHLKNIVYDLSNLAMIVPPDIQDEPEYFKGDNLWNYDKICKHLQHPSTEMKSTGKMELKKIFKLIEQMKASFYLEKVVLEKEITLYKTCHSLQNKYTTTTLNSLKAILDAGEAHIKEFIVDPITSISASYDSFAADLTEENMENLLSTLKERCLPLIEAIGKSPSDYPHIRPLADGLSSSPFFGNITQRFHSDLRAILKTNKAQYNELLQKKLHHQAVQDTRQWKD